MQLVSPAESHESAKLFTTQVVRHGAVTKPAAVNQAHTYIHIYKIVNNKHLQFIHVRQTCQSPWPVHLKVSASPLSWQWLQEDSSKMQLVQARLALTLKFSNDYMQNDGADTRQHQVISEPKGAAGFLFFCRRPEGTKHFCFQVKHWLISKPLICALISHANV